MTFPTDAMKLPLSPKQLVDIARTTRRRLPEDREFQVASDPAQANEYSKAIFGGGQLPEPMHNRVLLESFSHHSDDVKEYLRRIEVRDGRHCP